MASVDAYDLPLLARQVSLPRPPQRLFGNQQRDDDAEHRRPYGGGLGILERGQVDAAQAEAVERVSERRDGALRCRYILRRVVHHPGRVSPLSTGQKGLAIARSLVAEKKKSNHSARCFLGSACRQFRTLLGLRAACDRPLGPEKSISRPLRSMFIPFS